jgi:hypothetical protein
MTLIKTVLNPTEVELELLGQVRLLTIRLLCLSTWVNDKEIKVLLKKRSINRRISALTITLTKTIHLNLKKTLLSTRGVKDKLKFDPRELNDPERIKIRTKVRNKGRKMSSVFKVMVKYRNDERMKFPHLLRRFRWNQNRDNKKERKSLNSMLFQRYLAPLSRLMKLMID